MCYHYGVKSRVPGQGMMLTNMHILSLLGSKPHVE